MLSRMLFLPVTIRLHFAGIRAPAPPIALSCGRLTAPATDNREFAFGPGRGIGLSRGGSSWSVHFPPPAKKSSACSVLPLPEKVGSWGGFEGAALLTGSRRYS